MHISPVPDCDPGYFGIGCGARCNCNNATEICSPTDGACLSGCPGQYTGLNCSIFIRKYTDYSTQDTSEICSPTDGAWLNGCPDQYKGLNCSILIGLDPKCVV